MVSFRLDYCKSLFKGLLLKMLWSLKVVQNAAVVLVTRTSQSAHIFPVLQQPLLIWDPHTSGSASPVTISHTPFGHSIGHLLQVPPQLWHLCPAGLVKFQ